MRKVDEHPLGQEVAHIGVVTFDATAKTSLALAPVSRRNTMPTLEALVGVTNYGAAFKHARATIDGAVKQLSSPRLWRPIVFFISDGQPWETNVWDGHTYFPSVDLPWKVHRDALVDRSWKYSPKVVAFGFGDAKRKTLQSLSLIHI